MENTVRLALVGGADAFHGKAFAAIINGYDQEGYRQAGWWLPTHRTEGARIVKVWDPDGAAAARLASLASIPQVAASMEECADGVDGVVITDDLTMAHQKRAPFFLRQGLPTFVDKPLSPDPLEAEEIVAVAERSGAPLMTGSALRYSREVEALRSELDLLGEVLTAWVIGPGDLIFYGIHALELLHSVAGPGVRSVRNSGTEGREMVHLEMASGLQATMAVCQGIAYVFGLCLYGTKGWRCIEVQDSSYFYGNMLAGFLDTVRTGRAPTPPAYALEIIRALNLARQSREEGGTRLML